MSARRAAIRREKHEREKIMRSKAPDGEYQREYMRGTIHGRVCGICITLCLLKELHRFGKDKLINVLETSNKEAVKYEEDATRFNMKFYQDRMMLKLQKVSVKGVIRSMKEQVYIRRRNELFISSCSLIFITLSQEYSFASNSKGNGRLDVLMEYAINEYIKMQLDPDGHDTMYYVKKLKDETGIRLKLEG